MDTRVVIQRATDVVDDYGQRVPTWTTLATLWAQVSYREGSGSESIQSAQILSKQPVHFIVSYGSGWADVSPKDRVSYNSKLYNIEAVQEIGRKDGFRLTCTIRE
jgi:SPP1 family predicted phage head-tail adaptor